MCCCPSHSSSRNLTKAGLKDLISLLPVGKDDLINLKVDRQHFFQCLPSFDFPKCFLLHQHMVASGLAVQKDDRLKPEF